MDTQISHSTLAPSVERLIASSAKGRNILGHDGRVLCAIEDRLLHMKAQVLIDELIQMMVFIGELEKYGLESSIPSEKVHYTLQKIQSMDRQSIIQMLTKYLVGIRNFISSTSIRGVLFYKSLFESVLLVIVWEVDSLEEGV